MNYVLRFLHDDDTKYYYYETVEPVVYEALHNLDMIFTTLITKACIVDTREEAEKELFEIKDRLGDGFGVKFTFVGIVKITDKQLFEYRLKGR